MSVSERFKFLKLPKTIQFSCNEASEYSAVSVSKRFKILKLPKTIQLGSYYTCDKQVLWESAGAFFPRDNSLVSDRKSHNSDFFGLAVRCLLFNPEGPGSNPCLCANFLTKFSKQKILTFFDNMRPPLPLFGFLRLIFENFLMSPKGPPFIFLIFCNRTNVKKFKRVSSFRFFGTTKLLKIRIFFENFSKSPNGPPSIFLKYRKRMDVQKSQRTPLSQFSAL